MSGICGVLRLDGGPADGALLDRAIDRVAWRGPGGRGRWVHGPAGLGHARFDTTPEAAGESQPLVDSREGLVLVLDGRIDNREEILADLRRRGEAPRDGTDAELALRAWAAWGEGAPARIVGDWALAVWDARRRDLVLALDPLGFRPLFHRSAGGWFLFASSPLGTTAAEGESATLNRAYVGEMLTGLPVTARETVFEGVRRLLPGTLLRVSGGAVRESSWWRPGRHAEPIPRDERGYREGIRRLLETAVRCRLRSRGPVGILLSGGIDSGTVAVTAAAVLGPAGEGAGLRAYSKVAPGDALDESVDIRRVVGSAGLVGREDAFRIPGSRDYLEPVRLWRSLPPNPVVANYLALYGMAAREGREVLLTGEGGDEWPVGHPHGLADLLAGGRLHEALGQLAGIGPRRAAGALLRHGLGPLGPRPLKRAWSSLRGGPPRPSLLRPDFARSACIEDRLRAAPAVPPGVSREARALLGRLRTGAWLDLVEALDSFPLRCGVERRHPLMDLRFVETCLALPPRRRWRGDRVKILLRDASLGRLPDAVRLNEAKSVADAFFDRAILAVEGSVLEAAARLESEGIADGGAVRAALARLRAVAEGGAARRAEDYAGADALWNAFAAGSLMRSLEAGNGA